MRNILALPALLPLFAFGATTDDVIISQFNTPTTTVARVMTCATVDCFLIYDQATDRPKLIDFGDTLAFNGTTVEVDESEVMIPYANVTSTPTTLSGYGISDAAASSHTHACADLSNDTTIGCNIVTAANAAAVRALVASTQSHINDGATDAATNAPTNLNLLLLVTVSSEMNDANTRYNDLATKYNDLSAKFNTLLNAQEANAIVSP